MTQFSDSTAGFVYTAIRPQPVSLLCCALPQQVKCSFARTRGSATKDFTLLRGHKRGEILLRRRWNKRTFCSSLFFEISFWKSSPPCTLCCSHWTRWDIQSMKRGTGGNIFKLVFCLAMVQHWGNLKEKDTPRHFGWTKLLFCEKTWRIFYPFLVRDIDSAVLCTRTSGHFVSERTI